MLVSSDYTILSCKSAILPPYYPAILQPCHLMFPFKKKNPEKTPENREANIAQKGIKTMDTVVTGMILGGIIASLYGVKKLRDKDKKSETTPPDDHHQ